MEHGWARLGKPDFSTAAKLFYRLPAELRDGLNRSEERVLIWTLFLSWYQSYHSGRSTALASFSETWLGARFMRSRWTVGRALVRLENWNLLKRIRRPPSSNGTFKTNLIALTAKLTSLCLATGTRTASKAPCSKNAPQRVQNSDKAAFRPPFSGSVEGQDREKESCHPPHHLLNLFLAERQRLKAL